MTEERKYKRLARIDVQKNDPNYDLKIDFYNSRHSKQDLLNESLLLSAVIANKMPTLSHYINSLAKKGINLTDFDEDEFIKWHSLLKQAELLLESAASTKTAPTECSVNNTPSSTVDIEDEKNISVVKPINTEIEEPKDRGQKKQNSNVRSSFASLIKTK